MGLAVKIVPYMLQILFRVRLKYLYQKRCQHLFTFLLLLDEINHNNPLIISNYILNVSLENMGRKIFSSLNRDDFLETFLFLLPEKWDASSYLEEAVQMLVE